MPEYPELVFKAQDEVKLCPFCDSNEIETLEEIKPDMQVYIRMLCKKCENVWTL